MAVPPTGQFFVVAKTQVERTQWLVAGYYSVSVILFETVQLSLPGATDWPNRSLSVIAHTHDRALARAGSAL